MAKAGRGSDQFPLRLPDGLRDRIKATADMHGRSMNTEIVRVLEKEFPEPWPLDVRIKHLVDLLGALRIVRRHDSIVDELTELVLETVDGIASGRVPELDRETQANVRSALNRWLEEKANDEELRARWYERNDDAADRATT